MIYESAGMLASLMVCSPEMMVVGADHGIIRAGFDGLLAELRAEGLAGQG